jgi:hypothetical protein
MAWFNEVWRYLLGTEKYLLCVDREILPITQQECDLYSKQDSQYTRVSRNIVAYSGLYARISLFPWIICVADCADAVIN